MYGFTSIFFSTHSEMSENPRLVLHLLPSVKGAQEGKPGDSLFNCGLGVRTGSKGASKPFSRQVATACSMSVWGSLLCTATELSADVYFQDCVLISRGLPSTFLMFTLYSHFHIYNDILFRLSS